MKLSVSQLSCRRGGRVLFADLSLEMGGGMVVHVRGLNGAGKSSLLAILAGLLQPASGLIRVDGQTARMDALSRTCAWAGHLDGLKPALSIRENLTGWLRILGAGAENADAALLQLGLAGRADTRVQDCSSGERRRAALARVVGTRRPLWLLDEPSASLDEDGSRRLSEVLRAHTASGGLAVIATHLALEPAPDRVIELSDYAPGTATAPGDPFLGAA